MLLDMAAAPSPTSSAVQAFPSTAQTSPSSRASLFTVYSAASLTSFDDSDAPPPSPLDKVSDVHPPSNFAPGDSHHEHTRNPSLSLAPAATLRRSLSLSTPGPTQRIPQRTRPRRLPIAAKTVVGNGTVRLVAQPTHVVAAALASAAQASTPIRHFHLSATWGARLPELLDAVLPTLASSLLTLDISDCGLGQWPQGIRSCTKLESLHLSGNILLGNPPRWLSELTSLQHLTLDKVGLTELPTECVALQALESLSLTDNRMAQPPLWLYQLPRLRQLQLENNPLHQPWSDMLAPVIKSSPRAPSTPSATSISLELPDSPRSPARSSSFRSPTPAHKSAPTPASAPAPAPRKPTKAPVSPELSERLPPASRMPSASSTSFISSLKMSKRQVSVPTESATAPSSNSHSSSSPLSPSPRRPERLLSVPSTAKVPPASPSPGSPSTAPPSPRGSSLGRRFTAKLWRNKMARTASCPGVVPPAAPSATTPGANPFLAPSSTGSEKDYFSLATTGQHRSISGPEYEEPVSPGTSSKGTETLSIGPFDPGWPGLRPSSEKMESDKLEKEQGPNPTEETHTRHVRAVLRYLRDLDELCAPQKPQPEPVNSTLPGAPLPLMGLGPSMAQARPEVAEQIAALQRNARDDPARRKRVVLELIISEQTYVQGGLEPLVDLYARPCAALLPVAQHKLVFSNVESLLAFHKHGFLPALTKAAEPLLNPPVDSVGEADERARSLQAATAVGRVFVEHAAFLRMYASYINSCDLAQQIVMSWTPAQSPTNTGAGGMRKRSTGGNLGRTTSMHVSLSGRERPESSSGLGPGGEFELSQYKKRAIQKQLKRAAMDSRASALGLESYLLLPIQRIPRYRLLLEELVRCVPIVPASERKGGEADEVLVSALASVLTVARGMNEAKRFAEQEKRMYAWQEYFSTHGMQLPQGASLVQPHRRLVKEGALVHHRLVRPGEVYSRVSRAKDASAAASTGVGLGLGLNPSLGRSHSISAPRRPPRGAVHIPVLHQDLVEENVTALLCNDLLLLLHQPEARPEGAATATPGPASSLLRPRVQASIELHDPNQISVDGSMVRVHDTRQNKIYYLATASDAEARDWAESFQSISAAGPKSA